MKLKIAFLVLFGLLLIVVPAFAQSGTDLYCVAELEPVPFNEFGLPLRESRVLSEDCFSTPAAAMAFITKGAVSLPLTATQAEAEIAYEQYINSPSASILSYIVVQFYDSTGYNNFLYQYTAASPCTYMSGYAKSFGGTPYNDRAESGSAYGGCNKLTVTEHADYGGVYLDCYPGCSTFGILNNEVSAWISININP